MAATPIYGKNSSKSSSPEPAGRFPRNLVCSIGDSGSMRRFKRVPTIYVLSKNKKIDRKFQMKIVSFTGMINRCMLHGRVFVMLHGHVIMM